eukprot:TRINITY_DN24054_c0_g6_i1.p1 TRINITY_DN24054_c0_g6~~TRINITY_DN24054_c0_g6_i1.p1  ORF type:complete len:308 (-),score=42.41 TRINITY_DN24054_c0_g6_i1:64-918(-)
MASASNKATVLCRFEDDCGNRMWGQALDQDEAGIPMNAQLLQNQDPFADLMLSDKKVKVGKLLAPVTPTSIVCIGMNYRKHAAEVKMEVPKFPVVFHKSVSTLQHPFGPIEIPKIEGKVDWEVEFAIIIGRHLSGKPCKDVSQDEALKYVAGYTVANDVSGREWQLEKGGGQWCFGKSFDTFTPLGPVMVTPDLIPDPQVLQLRTTIDGEVMQDSNTSDMVFGVAEIISFLSQGTTLLPGTVILTGTPFGVGLGLKPQRWLKPGEEVVVEIEKIGKLSNRVQAA